MRPGNFVPVTETDIPGGAALGKEFECSLGRQRSGTGLRLPEENPGSHYYAARETDSAILHSKTRTSRAAEFEKFLFYRGVAGRHRAAPR